MRLLCPRCKTSSPALATECLLMGVSAEQPPNLCHPVGCQYCRNTGYAGRSSVNEIIAIDDELRTMIHDGASEQKMRKHARASFPSLRQDGYRRVLRGDTSLEEVLRVTSED
jgi:general secretion pathway protein E